MQVQTKADQQNQCSNVHGIANVLVRTCCHELLWRVKGSGSSSPARNEHCSTGERKQSSHRHENNSEVSVQAGNNTPKLRSNSRALKAIQPQKRTKPVM